MSRWSINSLCFCGNTGIETLAGVLSLLAMDSHISAYGSTDATDLPVLAQTFADIEFAEREYAAEATARGKSVRYATERGKVVLATTLQGFRDAQNQGVSDRWPSVRRGGQWR